jgi:hypothetical protein
LELPSTLLEQFAQAPGDQQQLLLMLLLLEAPCAFWPWGRAGLPIDA